MKGDKPKIQTDPHYKQIDLVASSKTKQDKGSVSKDIPSSLEELVSKEDLCGGTSDSDRTAIAVVKK